MIGVDERHTKHGAAAITATANPVTADSLAILAARAVALFCPLDEIAACLDFFPRAIRSELFAHLTHERLRGLEICWKRDHPPSIAGSDDDDAVASTAAIGDDEWSLEKETECEWRVRSKSVGAIDNHRGGGTRALRKRSFQQAFWEHRFRALLRARVSLGQSSKENESAVGNAVLTTVDVPANGSSNDANKGQEHNGSHAESREDDAQVDAAALDLFHDVVRHLKVHGREVVPRNAALISTLQQLHRLEVHHPEQQKTCWTSLIQLIQSHPSLTELCFFHGKLSDTQLQQIRLALVERATARQVRTPTATITTLEFVSIKIRNRGYRELTLLLSECQQLAVVRLSSCVADFENEELVANALSLPHLESFSLEHNDLEDDAFVAIANRKAPMSVTHLQLDSNAISVATLNGICTASLDGFLKLQKLELRNNIEVGDASIHAIAPMLSTGVTLTHLDLYNCNFGLEGATTLLLALGKNKTLTYLNIGHNFFGSSFGDLLADFLLANSTLECLFMNYVGLGTAGCTERLRQAMQSNLSLVEVSIGANRLRDDGADVLFQAIVERCRRKPFAFVDLSGNLLTGKGFSAIANSIERASRSDSHEPQTYERGSQKRRKLIPPPPQSDLITAPPSRILIRELSLLDNNFPRDLENGDVLEMLRNRIETVHTNTWVGKRNVYDDEV